MKRPSVTVVISTRNRGASIITTIRTILLNDYPHYFEVQVVDQSEDDVTEAALQPFRDHPRVRYMRSATKGVSIGRNLGINGAQSEFIAITDDNCEVPTNWLRELIAGFAVDSRIGIVFGNVLAVPHDDALGVVPGYVRHKPFLARSIHEKHQVEGLSGCMGLRRGMWQALGGFDQMLGVGAPLQSTPESDLTIRALLAGYYVYETPNVVVIHREFLTWEQRRPLMYRYWYGNRGHAGQTPQMRTLVGCATPLPLGLALGLWAIPSGDQSW